LRLAARHLERDIAPALGVAQFSITNGSNTAAIKSIADFDFFVLSVWQADQGAALRWRSLDTNQTYFIEVNGIPNRCGL
jgi:hypothetical protein